MKYISLLVLFSILFSCAHNLKDKTQVQYDANLTGFTYPYPVKYYQTTLQDELLNIAYMDEAPSKDIKGTIVLLHGKNFSGYYFEDIMKDLVKLNYRVIAIDQIGFGKSTKPKNIQYSFHLLAKLSHDLLNSIKVNKFKLVGHSMGGMIATRYALMYPQEVSKMILINPIGLEDYRTLTTFKTVDELYAMELKNSKEKIIDYQKTFYYDGKWNDQYEKLIKPAVGWINGPDNNLVALNAAKTSEIIYTQPVANEFKFVKVPTVLILGQRDKTAPGKNWAPKENQSLMGNYPELGVKVAKEIPNAKLIKLDGYGHVPFLENYENFMNYFLKEL